MQRYASFQSARLLRTRRERPAQSRVSCGPAVAPNVTEIDFFPPSDSHLTTAAVAGIIMHQEAGLNTIGAAPAAQAVQGLAQMLKTERSAALLLAAPTSNIGAIS